MHIISHINIMTTPAPGSPLFASEEQEPRISLIASAEPDISLIDSYGKYRNYNGGSGNSGGSGSSGNSGSSSSSGSVSW